MNKKNKKTNQSRIIIQVLFNKKNYKCKQTVTSQLQKKLQMQTNSHFSVTKKIYIYTNNINIIMNCKS